MTAFARLWRRSPVWRGAAILAVPTTLLAISAPPRAYLADAPPPSAAVADALPARTRDAPPSATLERLFPYYRSNLLDPRFDEATVAAQEVSKRAAYSGSAPFRGREIPLPPGSWTVVSLGPEAAVDDGLPAIGVVFARLEQHVVTGLLLARGSDRDAPSAVTLPANTACAARPARRFFPLTAPAGGDACWFLAWPVPPAVAWPRHEAPPALRIALRTLAATGDRLPQWLSGATWFRSDGKHWTEVTYFFDPARSSVVPTGADGRPDPDGAPQGDAMAAFEARLEDWMRRRIPGLEAMSAKRPDPGAVDKLNAGVPP